MGDLATRTSVTLGNMALRSTSLVNASRYGNGDRMHVILNGEPLEEVDCFKYLGSQVAADGDVKGMWYSE